MATKGSLTLVILVNERGREQIPGPGIFSWIREVEVVPFLLMHGARAWSRVLPAAGLGNAVWPWVQETGRAHLDGQVALSATDQECSSHTPKVVLSVVALSFLVIKPTRKEVGWGAVILADHGSLCELQRLNLVEEGIPLVLLGNSYPILKTLTSSFLLQTHRNSTPGIVHFPSGWPLGSSRSDSFCAISLIVPFLHPLPYGLGVLCAIPASSMQQNMQNVMICCHADSVNLTTADKQFLNRTCQFITVFSICVFFFLSHT